MDSDYESQLVLKLLSYSDEKTDIEKAKKEWVFPGEVIDYGPIKDQIKKAYCQLCDHPIRYGYKIDNTLTKRSLILGSECITNYTLIHYCTIEGSLKRLKIQQYNACINAFNGAAYTIKELTMAIRARFIGSHYDRYNKPFIEDMARCNTNNEKVVYDNLISGEIYRIAQKYDFTLRRDYIDTFLSVYQSANKTKNGFFKR